MRSVLASALKPLRSSLLWTFVRSLAALLAPARMANTSSLPASLPSCKQSSWALKALETLAISELGGAALSGVGSIVGRMRNETAAVRRPLRKTFDAIPARREALRA